MVAVMVPSPSYTDVPMDHWSYQATERLRHRNILDKDVDTLNPTMDVTREHFIKYLVKALELELIEEPIPFEDVDPADPLFPFISAAYHNGLTQGVNETTFGYGDVLTREQSMTFLVRSQKQENEADALSEGEISSKLEQFVDKNTQISQWARKYIVKAMNMGITEGYPDNTMRGTKLLNHAEVITLIDRMIQSTINTWTVKASQYNHIDDTYKKKKLNERWNILNGKKIQRDLYSAFLIMNVTEDLKLIDRDLCNKHYEKFLENHNKEINRIKTSKLKTLASMGI